MNGFVGAQMHILRVRIQLPAGRSGQGLEATGLAAGGHLRGAVASGFLERLLAPAAADHEVRHATPAQVEGDDGIFCNATALHEQNLEMRGHLQQGAKVGFSLLVNRDEFLAAVAHLHHAHATAMPVGHLGRRLLQYLQGHGGWAGGEVERARHAWLTPAQGPRQRRRRRRELLRRFPRCVAGRSVGSLRPARSASRLVWHGPTRGFLKRVCAPAHHDR